MTSKNSPLSELKRQANEMARIISAAERGEVVDAKFAEKIKEARDKPSFKVGIFMDDKVITIEILWSVVKSSGEVGLAEYILNLMRETRNTIQ